MAANRYAFETRWRVQGTAEEVFEILDRPEELARWWPAVWLESELVDAGDARGIGKRVRFLSKGWLPYLLRWTAEIREKEFPRSIVLNASGDFDGEGRWSFAQHGAAVDVVYLWTLEANKPLLRHLSFLFKPLFAANHHWAMARGLESLQLELARRKAKSAEDLSKLPAPPGPTFVRRAR